MSSITKVEKKIYRHVYKSIATLQNGATMREIINFTRHQNRNRVPVLNLEDKVRLVVSKMEEKFLIQRRENSELVLGAPLHQPQIEVPPTASKSVSFSIKRPRLHQGPRVQSLRMAMFGNATDDSNFHDLGGDDSDEHYSDAVSEPEEKKAKNESEHEEVEVQTQAN